MMYTMEDTIKKQEECIEEYPDINKVPLMACVYCPAKSDCGK